MQHSKIITHEAQTVSSVIFPLTDGERFYQVFKRLIFFSNVFAPDNRMRLMTVGVNFVDDGLQFGFGRDLTERSHQRTELRYCYRLIAVSIKQRKHLVNRCNIAPYTQHATAISVSFVCLCVLVCLSASISPELQPELRQNYCASCLIWPWLGRRLAALRYVVYFRFYG